MISVIGGIVLIIAGVVEWVGKVSLNHGLSILMVVIGIVVLLAGMLPQYINRRP